MEALTAVGVAALTLYDMVKAVDKAMVIGEICLLSKSGGASGTYVEPALRTDAARSTMKVLISIQQPVRAWQIPAECVDMLRQRFPDIDWVHATDPRCARARARAIATWRSRGSCRPPSSPRRRA